ncbi:hypothetical protein K151_586 [Proteus hauseri ZMd44]|nr:hypothetical protein K151_586 [Proteus hauseri ZMd44]
MKKNRIFFWKAWDDKEKRDDSKRESAKTY